MYRFANNSSLITKLSKTQLFWIVKSGGYFGGIFGPLLKIRLPLTKNVLSLLTKNYLIILGLTAALSTTDAAIQNNAHGSRTVTLIISNEEPWK